MINKRIYTQIIRPDKALVEAFRGIPVANIADEMNRMGCMDYGMRPFSKRPLLGVAVTVKTVANDNLLFHKAIQMCQQGDVIVVDAEGSMTHSLCGEMMFHMARGRGADGFIVDGAIRDYQALEDMDFSVYARGVQARGPYKEGPGEVNVPVCVGGIVVEPGDILVGDSDGIVVIKPKDAPEILKAAQEKMRKEKISLERILGGDTSAKWVDSKLDALGYEIIG